ncbi:MAG: FUSC family protein [Novosphingobium sp.]|nr:FUSC family protein [Novosphingobium sp.]
MVDEFECLFSVMLAIVLAHLIGAETVYWAAFTAFVLMRGQFSETLLRGFLRLVGTAIGAAIALAIVPYAARFLPLAIVSAAVVGAISLYGMLTARRAYAWLLFGLTFVMILLDKLEHPDLDTIAFASTRMLEVTAGTVACVSVSLLSKLSARKWWPAPPAVPAQRVGWHPDAARHALQAGVAVGLVPVVHALSNLPELEQAGITIMAVMIVPVTALAAGGLAPVSTRLLHRMIGCLVGSVLALAILLMANGSVPVLIAGTCLGILIGRHIENGSAKMTYVGLQFTLAMLVVLVPDSYADVSIEPGMERLVSIFVGMGILVPVLLGWHVLWPVRGDAEPAAQSADPVE